jgi:hypothetical protein
MKIADMQLVKVLAIGLIVVASGCGGGAAPGGAASSR